MRETGFILGWLFFIALKIAVDWLQIVKLKISPKHGFELIVMMVIGLVWMGLAGGVNEPGELPYALELLAFQAGSFALLFNGPLNLTRGLKWNYLGSGPFDSFWKRAGIASYVMVQIMMAILMGFGAVFIVQDLRYHI